MNAPPYMPGLEGTPLPAPPLVVSIRAPADPSSPMQLVGPPGTQISIPSSPAPPWKWFALHAVQIVIAISAVLLVAFKRADQQFLQTIFVALITAQLTPLAIDTRKIIGATP